MIDYEFDSDEDWGAFGFMHMSVLLRSSFNSDDEPEGEELNSDDEEDRLERDLEKKEIKGRLRGDGLEEDPDFLVPEDEDEEMQDAAAGARASLRVAV